MAANMLAGSGPSPSMSAAADGPPTMMQGQQAATPQAAPNMLAGAPQGQGAAGATGMQPPAPLVPPSYEKLQEAFHKQGYVVSALKRLMAIPDLSQKDVLNEVGEGVADGIMSPFDAAKQLKTLPPGDDSLALRTWVGSHYANAIQALQTVGQMIAAHGAMVRRQAMAAQIAQQPQPVMQNSLQGAPAQQGNPLLGR